MDNRALHVNSLPVGVLHRIFGYLGPKDLCRSSAVCKFWRDVNEDDFSDRMWGSFYRLRWSVRCGDGEGGDWRKRYCEKIRMTRVWRGQFKHDSLYGHNKGVRCVKLLPERNILATGSLDRTVRIWDLEAGMPIAVSKLHGGTVRCLALDAHTLISGSADACLRIWNLPDTPLDFNLCTPLKLANAHSGPVSGLSLTQSHIISGSWDCTVRLWSRKTLKCKAMWHFDDWVWDLAGLNKCFAVAAGRGIVLQDYSTGKVVYKVKDLVQEGHISCVEATKDGKVVLAGGADGVVHLLDTRRKSACCRVWEHKSAVSSLAFEDPWVASSSLDGAIALVNLEKKIHASDMCSSDSTGLFTRGPDQRRVFSGSAVYSLDMCDQWIACGTDCSVVKTWDFTSAEAIARMAAVSKAARKSRRKRRMGRKNAEVLPRIESGGSDKDDGEQTPRDKESNDENASDDGVPDSPSGPSLIPPSELLPAPELCRTEARRSYWANFRTSSRGGESTDEGEVLEGLA